MSSASLPDVNFPTEIQKDQQYDAVIVFAEEEAPFVAKLVYVLERFVTLEDDYPPRICVLDETGCLNWIQNRYTQFTEALNRSTSVFVYRTESLKEDKWAQMQKDAALTNEMNNNKGYILTLRGDANPDPFLDILKGVDVTDILTNNRKLTEVDDVENLISDDINSQFLTYIQIYFNRLLHLRKEREKADEKKRREWTRTNSAPTLQPVAAPGSEDSSRERLPQESRDGRQNMVCDGSTGRPICVVPPRPDLALVCPDMPPSEINPSPSNISSPDITPFSSGGLTDFTTPSLTDVLEGLNASSSSINMDMHQDPQNSAVGYDNAANQSVGYVSHSCSRPTGGSSIGLTERPQEEDPEVLFEDGASDVEIALDALQIIP